jgi:hypothetical protein
MLPTNQDEMEEAFEHTSIEMVQNWAKAVSADGIGQEDAAAEEEEDRESRFDRPLKEIRVGESPSRPWGISVPIFDPLLERPFEERTASPPPAPVSSEHLQRPSGKCPLGDDKQTEGENALSGFVAPETPRPAGKHLFEKNQTRVEEAPFQSRTAAEMTSSPAGKCPFGHEQKPKETGPRAKDEPAFAMSTQPAFINPADLPKPGCNGPQMIFTGPVFIGYPMEQALTFMQQFKGSHGK